MTKDISPTELIRSFMEFAFQKGKTDFPPLFYGTRTWHEFLYELKKKHKDKFPELECIGDFDWDGPYPTARVWHEIQTSLCILGVCGSRPGEGRTLLHVEYLRKENSLIKAHLDLLETMFQVAMKTDNFFEPGTFSCLLCGTTTLLPHVCPVFYPELRK